MRTQIKLFRLACGIALAGLFVGCSYSTSSTQNQVSGLKKRVLLTNQQTGALVLMDGQKDVQFKAFNAGGGAAKIVTGGGTTVIADSATNAIAIFDNATEKITLAPATSAIPFDVAVSPDGKTAWAAMRNPGFVEAFDTTNGNVLATISVPNAVRLVMSPQGSRLLVFSDSPNANTFAVIETANLSNSTTATTVTSANLDQPYTGVFNGNDTQAFILNCGAQCGGTSAGVLLADFTNSPATVGAPVPVAAATVGLLSGQSLFIAGTPPTLPVGVSCSSLGASTCGTLQVINTSNLNALTAGNPVAITDGLHQRMALSSNNRLYVGAAGCTTVASGTNQVRGCLSIFDTATQALTFPSESAFRQNFDVTAFQQISARNVMYVIQGGEIDFFDITTNAVATGITLIDIQGRAYGVLQIDP